MALTLVLGGVRSGKSARGERLATATGLPVTYVGTADATMAQRIAAHRARRPRDWATIEAGETLSLPQGCVLFDGLGVWLARVDRGAALAGVQELIRASADRPVIVVAEQAGQGMLPVDPVARDWLDLLGEAVQRLAAAAEHVELVVAGRPIPLQRPPAREGQEDGLAACARGRHPPAIACQPGGGRAAPAITIVGIGADGWPGLGDEARRALVRARLIVGSARQLSLLPAACTAARRTWPSPIDPLVAELARGSVGDGVCVLASGDPMLHGIGATLARLVGPQRLVVHPHVSAFALACARLGWPEAEVELCRSAQAAAALLAPGRRIVIYAPVQAVAAELAKRGYGPSRLVVLEQLGGPAERISEATAETWEHQAIDPLHAVAVECRAAAGALTLGRHQGLPDEAFESDGALTKWPVRSVTLAALAPAPGLLLWDIGAGSGSIAIEWLRAEPAARAIAIERRADRVTRIRANAERLGAAGLSVVCGEAPGALAGLPRPDVVFVGGGACSPGLIDLCVSTGARVVANAVTLEGERALHAAHAAHGGSLMRLEVSHARPLGSFSAWRPQLPIVQWSSR
ncbi:MAG TPA: precorrin-6y C5,15-methyltransferase (decarboxylating) subunit CbiE [Solirubrobacteraceae bacterium]|nr:precorrin-6y C5,15-methyltransferase (decarboxylating) subunit CbiE [Solirubrobacteraceae bacterium]